MEIDLQSVEACRGFAERISKVLGPYLAGMAETKPYDNIAYVSESGNDIGNSIIPVGTKGWAKQAIINIYTGIKQPWQTSMSVSGLGSSGVWLPKFSAYSFVGEGAGDGCKEKSLEVSAVPNTRRVKIIPTRLAALEAEYETLFKAEYLEERRLIDWVEAVLNDKPPKYRFFRHQDKESVKLFNQFTDLVRGQMPRDFFGQYPGKLKSIPGEKISDLERQMKENNNRKLEVYLEWKHDPYFIDILDGVAASVMLVPCYCNDLYTLDGRKEVHNRFFSREAYELTKAEMVQGIKMKPWTRKILRWNEVKDEEKGQVQRYLGYLADYLESTVPAQSRDLHIF